MAVHRTIDALKENGATITQSSYLLRRLEPENPGMITDANLGDIQLRMAAGNGLGLYGGRLSAYGVDENGKPLTQEEKEEQERRRATQFASSLTLNNVVTQEFYDDYLRFNQERLQELQQQRTTVVREIEEGDKALRSNEEEIARIKREMEEGRQPFIEAERAHVAAIAAHHGILNRVEQLTRARNNGGSVDEDGSEFEPTESAPDGTLLFIKRDPSGNESIVDRQGSIAGQRLETRLETERTALGAASERVTQTDQERERVRGVYTEFSEDRLKRLEALEKRQQEISSGQATSRRSLESIDSEIAATKKTLEYLKSDDVQARLKSGNLTIQEIQQNSSAIAWNKFREENQEYGLTASAMTEREQGIFDNIMSRIKNAGSAVVEQAGAVLGDNASTVGKLVSAAAGPVINSVTTLAGQIISSASATDGQGIKADVKLSSAFSPAAAGIQRTPEVQTNPTIDPVVLAQRPMAAAPMAP